MKNENLSPDDSAHLLEMMGRPVSATLASTKLARTLISMEKADRKRGAAYIKRVWAVDKNKLDSYLATNATKCAAYAMDAVTLGRDFHDIIWTYRLVNPHGEIFPNLGEVHFRRPALTVLDFLPSKIAAEVNSRNIIAIERIELHPSLHRNGYFNLLMDEAKQQGFRFIALQNVANPSWAYHFYRKSKTPNSRILLTSEAATVDFESMLSPLPSFVFMC